jgi:hypothetical protein
MCPTLPCPLAPIARKISVELGLEGFFRAPSRPVPNFSGGRGEAFFLPAEWGVDHLRPAVFSRQFWHHFWFWRARRGASLVRAKCCSGGISNTQILPDAAGIHKAILRLRHRYISRSINGLRGLFRCAIPAPMAHEWSGRGKTFSRESRPILAYAKDTFGGRFAAMKRFWNANVWAGFILVLAGAISYPLFFARFQVTRDVPWANLAILALALILLGVGITRAFRRPDAYRGKIFGSVLGVVAVALTVFFC